MNKGIPTSIVVVVSLLAGCASTSEADKGTTSTTETSAAEPAAAPAPAIRYQGQPTADDMRKMKDDGVVAIISLRAVDEDAGFDEEALAKELGIGFARIPVAQGAAALTDDETTSIKKWLSTFDAPAGKQVIVHCGSGERAALVESALAPAAQ